MRKIIIHTLRNTGVSTEKLYVLFQQSFQQWRDLDIVAPFINKSFEEFKEVIDRSVVFVAQDRETGEVLGMHCFYCYPARYVFDFFLAVSPHAKRQGIATKILQEEVARLRQRGYRYMKCTTNAAATWSVRWHLKNGYRIVGYSRGKGKNYPSYTFRKQLAYDLRHHPTDFLWLPYIAPVTARLSYAITYLATCICKKRSGELNVLGKFAKRLRR